MSLRNHYTQYRQTTVETASQMQLIIMLHDGAMQFLRQATAEIGRQNYSEVSRNINRATDIMLHLWSSLDLNAGGDVAANLNQLFPFMIERVTRSVSADDPRMIEDVIDYLRTLRDAWFEVERARGIKSTRSRSTADLSLAA